MGNNAKFIVDWGLPIIGLVFLLALYFLYRLNRKHKYYLPKGFLGYLGSLTLIFLLFVSFMAFNKVMTIKPRISEVIYALENLKGKPAPAQSFQLVENLETQSIEDYKGSFVLLNFWATWCAPCIKEMPELNKLYDNYKDQGLIVLTLSDETPERVLKFMEKHEIKTVSAVTKKFSWCDIQTERPITFLVDKQGVIIDYFTGGYDYTYFENKIEKHMK